MSLRLAPFVGLCVALAACNIDFDASVPCTSDDECPGSMRCDLDFARCVDELQRRDGAADDAVDDATDVGDAAPSDVAGDVPPADVTTDADVDGASPDADLDVADTTDAPSDAGDVADAPLDAPTDAGDAADGGCVPVLEVCDGADNDCDGDIDEDGVCEGCGANAVLVEREGVDAFCIDTYEASRPDATAASAGTDGSRAVSQPGVLPWANVTLDQASAACEAAGRRLCSPIEWVAACQGAEERLYPYGMTYAGLTCNGANTPPLNAAAGAGSFPDCVSQDGTFDQSGNLAEWVSDLSVRGGAFEDPQLNLQCRSRRIPPSSDGPSPAFGFRCCSDP